MSKEKLLELVDLVYELNHPIDFQINLAVQGYLARFTEGLFGLDLTVTRDNNHDDTKRFGDFDKAASEYELSEAIEWLKELHEEMMIQESRK